MTVVRRFACTIGALALATPAVLGLSVGTALAESVSTPSDGSVISSGSNQTVTGSLDKCSSNLTVSCPNGSITVTDPSGKQAATKSVARSRSATTTVSTSVDLAPTSTANGAWTVVLKGASTTTTHFYTDFAPATPSGFSASSSEGDQHDVFLQWSKGNEPDLQSYTLYDGNGSVLQSGITPGSACSGSTCHYALYYDNVAQGTYTYSYKLSATRAGGCAAGSCAAVESGQTSTRTASLTTPAPPPPSPTPAPTQGTGGTTGGTTTGGSTTGGSTGGSSTGGTTTGSGSTGSGSGSTTGGVIAPSAGPLPTLPPNFNAKATALNFGNFSASLGIPKLPPLPDTSVVLPGSGGEGAEQQGTYNPTLPYKSVADAPTKSGGVLTPIAQTFGLDPEKLAKSLAIALILIMTAAHLRRWIGSHVEV